MTSVGGCKTAAMLSEGVCVMSEWVMSVNSLSTAFNPIWDL